MSQHLMTIYLCLLNSPQELREKIYSKAKKFKHYNTLPTKEQLEYIENFPIETITKEELLDSEISLFEYSGISVERQSTLNEFYSFLMDNLPKNSQLALFSDVIKNKEKYSFHFGVISSRSLKVAMKEYEWLHDIELAKLEKGGFHVNLLNEITKSK